MRKKHLSHRRLAKSQASLRISAVSPEPLLFTDMSLRPVDASGKTHVCSVDRGLRMRI